ncbi:MAG: hypothetical protein RRY79_07125 [Clostridia bacterium]
MKKNISFVLALMMLSAMLIGCTPQKQPTNTGAPSSSPLSSPTVAPSAAPSVEPSVDPSASAAPKSPLEAVIDDIVKKAGESLDGTVTAPVTVENAQDLTGLTAEQFTENIKEAINVQAMININAHLIVLLEAGSPEKAESAAKLIAGGFNTRRWVCVTPEKCAVITGGNYVLLVASNALTTDKLVNAFIVFAGDKAGQPDFFFENKAE